MKVQTLVVTINQTDHSLTEKMNIQTNAVVGNQCDRDAVEVFDYNGNTITYLSHKTTGVGRNRNTVLMRADAEICILADDDMTFLDGYEKRVMQWFEEIPKADVLIFNLQESVPRRYAHRQVERISWYNYRRYGAARIVFRRDAVLRNGIHFNVMFGGGSPYSCGEDTLFLDACLKAGLKIYGVPDTLASIQDGDSTWFTGYHDKYFFDRGVLYYTLSKRLCGLLAIHNCIKHRKRYAQYGWLNAILQMMKGIRSVK